MGSPFRPRAGGGLSRSSPCPLGGAGNACAPCHVVVGETRGGAVTVLDPQGLYAWEPKGLSVVDMALAQESAGLVMLYHFDGYIDAGETGDQIVDRLLDSLPHQVVARFDHDRLVDYRARLLPCSPSPATGGRTTRCLPSPCGSCRTPPEPPSCCSPGPNRTWSGSASLPPCGRSWSASRCASRSTSTASPWASRTPARSASHRTATAPTSSRRAAAPSTRRRCPAAPRPWSSTG